VRHEQCTTDTISSDLMKEKQLLCLQMTTPAQCSFRTCRRAPSWQSALMQFCVRGGTPWCMLCIAAAKMMVAPHGR
jgi:hypothetical protein